MKLTLKTIVSIICVLSTIVVPFTSYSVDVQETPEEEHVYGYIPDDPEWVASVPEFSAPSTYSAITVPSSCDNSDSPYFPEITSQGGVGACTAYATTYYQFTYEVNKYLELTTTPENTYNPQWTYSMSSDLNYMHMSEPYKILQNFGGLRYSDYTEEELRLQRQSVDYFTNHINANTEAKINALSNRAQVGKISIPFVSNKVITFNGEDSFLATKLLLISGKVLTIGVRSPGDPQYEPKASDKGTHAGDTVICRCNSSTGLHAVTIVGYDDNVCVDLNNDGVIQNAERGAFKVANSWGKNSYNDGYFWVLYDAFNKISAHPDSSWENGYTTTRESFCGETEVRFYYITILHEDVNFVCQMDVDLNNYFSIINLLTSRKPQSSESFDNYFNHTNNSYSHIAPYEGTIVFGFYGLDSPISECYRGYDWKFSYLSTNVQEGQISNIRITDNKSNTIHAFEDCYTNGLPVVFVASIDLEIGDVNYDGVLNSDDVDFIKQCIVGFTSLSSVQSFLADVNADGRINATDVALLNRMIAMMT